MSSYDDQPLRGMVDDCQIVEINQTFGYAWDGEEFLRVGDMVILPGTHGRSEWVGTVTAMGSRWPFEFKKVVRKAEIEDVEAYEKKLESAAKSKES